MRTSSIVEDILAKDFKISSESDAFLKMATMLEQDDQRPARREEVYKFFEERTDIQLVPKIKMMMEYVFERVEAGKIVRLIVKGPRGGGKTFGIASCIEFPLWFFYDFDCVNMGGSSSQAKKAYKAIKLLLDIPEVERHVERSVISSTEKKNGTWINVLATSSKQVRSPHPGNKRKGGLLFIDEECEVPEADPPLVSSAIPLVNSANPSVIIRSSTQHKVGDSFEDCWDNAKEYGYKRIAFDIFDSCRTCTRSCHIPLDKDPERGCIDSFRMDTKDKDGKVTKPGYCKGRAHHDGLIVDVKEDGTYTTTYDEAEDWKKKVDGWVSIDEIFQGWKESDVETFEVEWLGGKKSRKGKIYDPVLLDEAAAYSFEIPKAKFLGCDKSVGIDWGFSGMCVVTYFFQYANTIFLYHVDIYKQAGIDETKADIIERVHTDKIDMALGDAAGKYENDSLASGAEITVHEIPFGTYKEFGIANIKNHLEKKTFKILKTWQGQRNPGYDTFFRQMKEYKYDNNGKPMKKNDHGPDSALCGMLRWAPKRKKNRKLDEVEPRIMAVR